MDFNAKQMREDALLKKGQYKFTVLHTKEKTSAKGTDMFILKMRLDVDGRPVQFWATLLMLPSMFWLFEHFCKATGLEAALDAGTLMAQDCDGKEGTLEINHRVNKETGEVEAYVKDFIAPEVIAENDAMFNDDVPNFA